MEDENGDVIEEEEDEFASDEVYEAEESYDDFSEGDE